MLRVFRVYYRVYTRVYSLQVHSLGISLTGIQGSYRVTSSPVFYGQALYIPR
jgi:hypothetical protein